MALATVWVAFTLPGIHTGPTSPVVTRGSDADLHSGRASFADQQLLDRAFPAGTVPPNAYTHGIQQAERFLRAPQQVTWKELGPVFAPKGGEANPKNKVRGAISGRTTALAVDPATCRSGVCNTIYAGAASGGIWKTSDAGRTWRSLTDSQADLAIGTITLDPQNPNIVYVGTGDPNHGSGSHRGVGILRSTDGGRTWVTLGSSQFANRAVSSIVVDPRTAGTSNAALYVTTDRSNSGGAPTGGSDSGTNPHLPPMGFSISTDGGQTWTLSNPAGQAQDSTGGIQGQSLVMDPGDPNTLYAGFIYDGLFKSSDDGGTWQRLSGGLPRTGFYTIKVALPASSPQIVYTAFNIMSGNEDHESIYRSDDGGATWTSLPNTPNACDSQCFGDMILAVDPVNPNVLYAGGTANYGYLSGQETSCGTFNPLPVRCNAVIMKSTNGGATWADIGENGKGGPVHADDRAILIDPTNPQDVYLGTDGGVYHSSNAGKSWQEFNRGLATFQVNGVAVSRTGAIIIGTQDNGTLRYNGSTTWSHIDDGDGGLTAVDPKNPRISFTTQYGSSLDRNDRNGTPYANTFVAPFWGDQALLGRGQFYEPYALAPTAPKDIFYGTYRVWRSKMRGGVDGNHDGDATNDRTDKIDWVPISFDLSCSSRPSKASQMCDSDANQGQGISALAVSPRNPNVVVAATANGEVWLTANALATAKTDHNCDPRKNRDDVAHCNFSSGVIWRRIDSGLPRRFPTALRFAPGSSSTLYLSYSGFNENTPSHRGHIFRSTNLGRTWTNLSGSGPLTGVLPDLPYNDVLVNPTNGHLYAAADFGIYMSTNGGTTWARIDQGLPGVSTYQMQYSPRDHALVAGTYGRGVWRTAAP